LSFAVTAVAAQLAWDPSPDPTVVGYVIYVGQSSGVYSTTVDVGPATQYAFTNLPSGSTNYFAVTAYDGAGAQSIYSNEVSATEVASGPVASFSASATTGVAPMAVNFTNASTGSITGYAWNFGDGTSSTSQNPAKVYSSPGVYTVSLQVTGPGGTNTQTRTNYITATSTPAVDTIAPSMPSSLVATSIGNNSIAVTWYPATDNVGVVGYRLERCKGKLCSDFVQIAAPTATSYTDSALIAGTTYRYRVRAVDAAGNAGGYSVVGKATTSGADTIPPTAPGTPVKVSDNRQTNLRWPASSDNVGVVGYRVERCLGVGCTNFAEIGVASGTKFNDTNVTPSATYRYRVRAFDAAGNLSAYSPISTITISP
jgi:PKD repeat protein